MIFYVDSDYRCHAADDGTMLQVEDTFFDGKCTGFLEGHRYVPAGCTWLRQDGTAFEGIMIAPLRNDEALAEMQRQYEREQLADMKAALALLGVEA